MVGVVLLQFLWFAMKVYIINVIQITGYRDAFYIVNESQFVECQNKETMHNGKVLKIKTFGTFLINLKLQTGCCRL